MCQPSHIQPCLKIYMLDFANRVQDFYKYCKHQHKDEDVLYLCFQRNFEGNLNNKCFHFLSLSDLWGFSSL